MSLAIQPGQVLGDQWEVLEKLGRGGMADVFRVFSRVLRLECVAKVRVLGPNTIDAKELRMRFEREACVLVRVPHPHLVKAFSFFPATPGQPDFFTMECLQGASLKELIDPPLPGEERQHGGGLLSEERALGIMIQICKAVTALHTKGVFHRDIKPGNIMVGQRDGHDHATLIDLGICKCTAAWYPGLEQRTPVEQRFETDPGRTLGTPGFMGAGEHADLTSRDVFGICATLFRIVLGRTPYRPEPKPGEVLQWQPADDERISESLKSVLDTGLGADPRIRFPSVEMLREELGYVLEEIQMEQSDHGESALQVGVEQGKDAPKDMVADRALERLDAALDDARQGLVHVGSEHDGAETAPLGPESVPAPVPMPATAVVDDARREEVHAANEIDGAKPAPLAALCPETAVSELEPTAETIKQRRLVRRIAFGALACVGIGVWVGWLFFDGTPGAPIENPADHAAAGIVAERTPAETRADAALHADGDADHARAIPAEITPKQDDARPSGFGHPVAEPTAASRRHALTKASFRQVLASKRSVLDKCSQNLDVDAVVDAIVRISATGEVTSMRLSPAVSFLVETCVRDAIGGLRFPATGTPSTHRVRLRYPAKK
ncbi:MAG TPA: serine/threonine protein kinase [Nannocystis exedens]|nr:serine/threonine protein kinase [Nannocystis exedens]